MALDLGENVTTAIMTWRHQAGQAPPLAPLASVLTQAKAWGLKIGLGVLLLGVAVKLLTRLRG